MPEPAVIASIDLSANVITTAAAHGFSTGRCVGMMLLSAAGVLPASTPQVTVQGIYFARSTGSATLTLHATAAAAQAGTGPIDFTGAQTDSVGLASLTVKERIERDIVSTLAAIAGIGTVERWDARNNTRGHLSAVVKGDDESLNPAASTQATVEVELPVRVQFVLAQPGDDPSSTSELTNFWLGLIESALLADITRGGVARYTQTVGTEGPDSVQDEPEAVCALDIMIEYHHFRGDPYTPI